MKSLSSSRLEVLVDCFHVYTYYISYLLPGCARTQHPAAPLHHFFSHYPAAATDSPWHVRSTEEILWGCAIPTRGTPRRCLNA